MTSTVLTPGQISGISNIGESRAIPRSIDKIEDQYPNLYLPVVENYRKSNKFYGYTDSASADYNPMILVELTGLSYRYGTTTYAVDRVNGTMYGKFSVSYRVINERAPVEPQFRYVIESEYVSMQPTYANTLPGKPVWSHLWPHPPQ